MPLARVVPRPGLAARIAALFRLPRPESPIPNPVVYRCPLDEAIDRARRGRGPDGMPEVHPDAWWMRLERFEVEPRDEGEADVRCYFRGPDRW